MRGSSGPSPSAGTSRSRDAGRRGVLVLVGAGCVVAGGLLVVAGRAGGALAGTLLVLEGGVLLAVAAGALVVRPLPAAARLAAARPRPGRRLEGARLGLPLAAATALALVLRLVGLDGDFWLDEVVTVRDYASRSFGEILTTYDAPNNHLLNSLLAHGAFLAFGYAEWAIRLPALVAGVAAVPALFWVARPLLGDVRALAAAALLAVAAPHVLFSQNARGYTLLLLFGLLATGALARGLREDGLRWWALYAGSAVLTVAAVPTGAFLVAGHALVGTAAVVAVARAGGSPRPLAGRLTAVFALVTVLTVQVYAPVLTRIPGSAQDAWRDAGAGSHVLSAGFVRELAGAVSTDVGPALALAALPFALVGLVGLRSLLRRDWALPTALVLGPLLHALLVAIRGLAFSPRFLLFLTFAILLVAVESVTLVARRAGALAGSRAGAVRGSVEVAGLALAAAALAAPFVRIAGLPNQPYRAALARAVVLRPDSLVIGVYPADSGVHFYGVDHPGSTPAPDRVATARTLAAFDALVASAGRAGVVVLTSQSDVLRASRPALYRRLEDGFAPAATLPARIGGGAITVSLPRRGSGS